MCFSVVSLLDEEHPWKIRTIGMLLNSMVFLSPMKNERFTPMLITPNSRCFEGLLLVFDCNYSRVCIFVAYDHLLGMLPTCKQHYFLDHLQNHNWWNCASQYIERNKEENLHLPWFLSGTFICIWCSAEWRVVYCESNWCVKWNCWCKLTHSNKILIVHLSMWWWICSFVV
jgi:hypothetical protein